MTNCSLLENTVYNEEKVHIAGLTYGEVIELLYKLKIASKLPISRARAVFLRMRVPNVSMPHFDGECGKEEPVCCSVKTRT